MEKDDAIDKAKIIEEFENFEKEDSYLSLYYKTFYWTMTNYLQAYRVASAGIVATNSNFNISNAEKNIGIFGKVEEVLPVIGKVIGAIDSAIHALFEIFEDNKLKNNKNAINKIITSKLNSEK